MKKVISILMAAAVMVACGNSGNNKKASAPSEAETAQEAVQEPVAASKAEPKAEAKKWYEQDFCLTNKMYILGNSISQTYARKGNILVCKSEGDGPETLIVCTDSSRTAYLVGDKGTYVKRSEKTGFSSVEDAIYKYLRSQMSETVFGKNLKKDDPDCKVRDTTIFGRPAYIITKEATEKNIVAEAYGKTIMHIDKENAIPYYKYALVKTNGQVVTDGKVFELTAFSANPTYEGLIMSLDGLTEVK